MTEMVLYSAASGSAGRVAAFAVSAANSRRLEVRTQITLEIIIQRIDGREVAACRPIQQQIDRGQCREPLICADFAQARRQCAAAEHSHRHAGKRCRLQSNGAGTDTGDLPVAPDPLQLVDRMFPINVAGRQHRQRHRIDPMRVGIGANHPDQLFLADHLAAGEALHFGHQRKIDLSATNQSNQRRRQFAAQFDLYLWKRLAKAAQKSRAKRRPRRDPACPGPRFPRRPPRQAVAASRREAGVWILRRKAPGHRHR